MIEAEQWSIPDKLINKFHYFMGLYSNSRIHIHFLQIMGNQVFFHEGDGVGG